MIVQAKSLLFRLASQGRICERRPEDDGERPIGHRREQYFRNRIDFSIVHTMSVRHWIGRRQSAVFAGEFTAVRLAPRLSAPFKD
jgi:hypothetical protein